MSVTPEQAAAWEAEGRRLAPALDPVAAVVVAGMNVDAAAHLALGMAAGQATRRRVAVADLTGRAAPIARLVPDDDPHGLGDTFAFGVSLNRVARQLDPEGRLFVIPSGTEPALRPELAASDRWRRIADGFRDVGALLLLVGPADAPGLAELVQRMDGVVAADEEAATVALPHRIITASLREAAAAPAQDPRPRTPVVTPASRSGWIRPLLYVAAALAVIAVLVWLARQVGGSGARGGIMQSDSASAVLAPPDTGATTGAPDSAASPGAISTAGVPDGAVEDDSTGTAVEEAVPAPPVANLADSSRAAAFSVAVASAASEPAAMRAFRNRSRALASVTIGQADDGAGSTRFYVVTWAGLRASDAEAELARLRRQGLLEDGTAAVVRLPYALQVESSVSPDSVRVVLNRFLARGIPAYALLQPNGRAHIYVGAFGTPSDARSQLVNLQSAAIPAALAVRTGRPL